MRILQLCHKPPYPIIDGGCLAIQQISNAVLREGHSLKIISVVTPKHPFIPEAFPENFIEQCQFKAVFVDTSLNIVDAFSNLITADSYHISRFFSSDLDKELMHSIEDDFDLIICESIFVAPYIPTLRRYSKAKIVLRSHNLEFSIWHRLARSHKSGLKKTYLKILTAQLKKYEIELLQHIDGLIAINSDELKHYRRMGYTGLGATIPFGVNLDEYRPLTKDVEPLSVFHLGSMDWKPNEEAVEWFLEKVWPRVVKQHKEAHFWLAGRNMPPWITSLSLPQVTVVGEVSDARHFINSKQIMAIPLLSGGGMRVKMIEGLAMHKAVVSTPLGAKGVAVKHGHNALIARGAEEFSQQLLYLLSHADAAAALGANGRKLVEERYNIVKLAHQLTEFFTAALK